MVVRLFGCISCILLYLSIVESHLVKSSHHCIPTSIVRGPCHTCLCMLDGVFHCRSESCNKAQSNFDSNDVEQDCQPGMTYNHKTLYCHCNDRGQWKSENCKTTFFYLIHKIPRRSFYSKFNCIPNIFYLRECNVCYCGKNGVIQDSSCTNRTCSNSGKTDSCKYGQYLKTTKQFCACTDNGNYHDRSCIEATAKPFQIVERDELEKIVKLTGCTMELRCAPNMIYYVDCNKCECVDGKLECEETDCNLRYNENKLDAVRQLSEEMKSLPQVQSDKERSNSTGRSRNNLPEIKDGEPCTPGKAYMMECNTCWCSNSKNLICTKMACLEWPKHRVNLRSKENGLPELPKLECEPGKFYKKGCQKCFCTDLKFPICTTKHCKRSRKPKENEINSVITSPDDISPPLDDIEFENLPKVLHGASDCIPGGRYRWDCNVCICMANGNLLCQQNYCLHMGESNRLAAKKNNGKPCNETQPSEKECVSCTCSESGRYTCTPIPDCIPDSARRQLHGIHEKFKPRVLFDLQYDKCVPHMVYKIGCNNCYCQKDHSLRCTRKGCLNKEQVKQLIRPIEKEDEDEEIPEISKST